MDAVINHMAGVDAGQGTGTGGSWYDTNTLTFDGVPFGGSDFNSCGCGACCSGDCNINNYNDKDEVNQLIKSNYQYIIIFGMTNKRMCFHLLRSETAVW